MSEALFWLYLTNAVLLINHEIDSAYWKEWELFHPASISRDGAVITHPVLRILPGSRVVCIGLVLLLIHHCRGKGSDVEGYPR
jgi:hypothetical protein